VLIAGVPSVSPPSLQVNYTEEGIEAIIFTADGDMRQALNNLQARACVRACVRAVWAE